MNNPQDILEYERNYSRGIHDATMTLKTTFLNFRKFYNKDFEIKDFHKNIKDVVDFSVRIEEDLGEHLRRFNEIKKHNTTWYEKGLDRKAYILGLAKKCIPLQSSVNALCDLINLTMKDLVNIKYHGDDSKDNKKDLIYIKSDIFKDRLASIRDIIFETEELAKDYASILNVGTEKLLKIDMEESCRFQF